MPELPDVETFKKYLDRHALHKKIDQIEVRESRILEKTTAKVLSRHLNGAVFHKSERYGKYLFIHTGNREGLALHFGMTGYLKYYANGNQGPPHERLRIDFSNGHHLGFSCRRMLGKVRLYESLDEMIGDKKLGPDALKISENDFTGGIKGSRAMVKTVLINQSFLAGIGNVYADEILFQACVHPETSGSRLSDDEIKTLYKNMRDVLRTAARKDADPDAMPGTYLLPRRKHGSPCPRGGGTVKKTTAGGRSTYYCPQCQRKK